MIEDMLVGALPWDAGHAKQVPGQHELCARLLPAEDCGASFMFDRFGHQKGAAAPKVTLTQRSRLAARPRLVLGRDGRAPGGGGLRDDHPQEGAVPQRAPARSAPL